MESKIKNPLRRLFLENKELRIFVILTPIFMVLEIFLTIYMADLFKNGIDIGLQGGEGYGKIALGLDQSLYYLQLPFILRILLWAI
ncbi:hypothetical protein HYG86_03300 [Alkalicella caledoniensis]|uniref:Uncharacterized protein n=1 Tax=Alkalicella caledoniensis TaxID=2731377 RepID=A0A7G9W598_ALKCA|nr:hypothetical protein [Alkalicella caledoniensis]QNO13860.1 hypothetical protein HYG86_03300 [Alkalicella caledoniensis]